jgi:hypothetical protein
VARRRSPPGRLRRAARALAGLGLAAAVAFLAYQGGCARRDLSSAARSLADLWHAATRPALPLERAPLADAVYVGRLEARGLDEASGLAPSRRRDDLLWSINDGRPSRLYALHADGSDAGFAELPQELLSDWEDLASFEWQGRPYLLIGDTGDNLSWERTRRLIAVEEPEPRGAGAPVPARVAWSYAFRFEDGPRDCESLAVDPETGRVLLLSKRTVPALLYELPLRPEPGATQPLVARRIGALAALPGPSAAEREDYGWRRVLWLSMPTALDLSPDGRAAVVLTGGDAYWFARAPQESWGRALGRPPRRVPLPPMRQAEALAFSRDGRSLFVTTERRPAPLFRLDRLAEPG